MPGCDAEGERLDVSWHRLLGSADVCNGGLAGVLGLGYEMRAAKLRWLMCVWI